MTILSNKNTPRVSYVASGSQTVFAIPFEFFNVADVKVYNGTTLLTYNASPTTTSQYSITGTASSSDEAYEFGSGGSITLGSTGASASDIITIIRDIAIERTSDFPSVGSFDITALNTQLDQIIAEIADRKQQSDRSIKLADTDSVAADLTLPPKATRASKVFAFDADGDPETDIASTGLATLSTVADEIAILGTADAVADMAILGTADVVTDMNVLATADVVSDMNVLASADFVADLNTLATSDIVTDMNLLATSANVTAMGLLGTSANVTAMGLLGNSATVTDLGILGTADVVSDMNILATADIVTDMNVLGTSANVTAMGVLGTSANVTAMANVSANIDAVNSFANTYRISSSAPTTSLDVGDLYFDTTANELKVYKSSGWAAAGSTVNGTSARFNYTATAAQTTFTGADTNGETLAYDAGFADVYLNGVRLSGADITITSGTSVVLAVGASAGDILDVVAYGTFNVASVAASAITSGTINEARLPASALGAVWESKSNDFTAEARKNYFCDTSSNDIDVTLPAGTIGDTIRFLDVSGTFDTNDLTILYGSSKIQGASANLDVATERAGFGLVYYNSTQGWLLTEK